MNHIVLCTNDNWSIPAGVLIESILFYNPDSDFTFHIIAKKFSKKSLSIFEQIQKKYQRIIIDTIFVTDNYVDSLPVRKTDHVTIETYFRFLIPDLLDKSISKILYLDGDILCTGSLDELFKTELSSYACAMCPDTRFSDI
jgi:lipopolysaccharide biosynthesis glycosyltransferase